MTETLSKPQGSEPTRRELSRWMIGVTKPVLGPLVGSTLCRIFDQLLGIALLVVPATALIYQNFFPARSFWLRIIAVMIGIALLKALLHYGEQFLGHFVAFKALELLRAEVYRRLYPQAPAIMNQTYSGDLLARLTRDIDRIEVFFAHTIAPVVSGVVVPATVTITVACLNPYLGLMTCIIFVAVFLAIIDKSSYRAAVRALGIRGKITQHLTDSIQGVAEVVGYGAQPKRLAAQSQLEDDLYKGAIRQGRSVGYRRGFIAALRMVAVLALANTGLAQLSPSDPNFTFTLAVTVGAIFAVVRTWEVVNGLADLTQDLNNSFAAARRVWDIRFAGLELPEGDTLLSVPGEGGKSPAGLEVKWEDVTFTYPPLPGRVATTPAIADASLVAQAGKITALVGATGCGKSTLTRLALRYYDPDRGRVSLGGVDLRELPLDHLRDLVALVTQDIRLFNNTVAWNLRLANPQASDQQLWDALRVAGLESEVRALPDGLQTPVGERGQSLSGGQRQRLSLAQAVLRRCPVLILDEFTAHLDPQLAARVRTQLRTDLPDATIIEVTHRLEHIDQVDWVAVVDNGKIVEQGRPGELRQREGALAHLISRDVV